MGEVVSDILTSRAAIGRWKLLRRVRSLAMSNDEKWESGSLEWIHRIRREMGERGENGPMPIDKQKALAARCGLKLVRLRERAEVK